MELTRTSERRLHLGGNWLVSAQAYYLGLGPNQLTTISRIFRPCSALDRIQAKLYLSNVEILEFRQVPTVLTQAVQVAVAVWMVLILPAFFFLSSIQCTDDAAQSSLIHMMWFLLVHTVSSLKAGIWFRKKNQIFYFGTRAHESCGEASTA
jgi:hypothetical protein